MVRDSRWCHYLPGTSRRAPEPLLGSRSLPVSLLLPVRRGGWLVQAEAELCVGTACWVPRPRWCENSTQFCSNLLPLQSNHARGHSHSHFLVFSAFVTTEWKVIGCAIQGHAEKAPPSSSSFFVFSTVSCLEAAPVVVLCWPVIVWLSRSPPCRSDPSLHTRMTKEAPAKLESQSSQQQNRVTRIRVRSISGETPTNRPPRCRSHRSHSVFGRLTFFLPSRGQEVTLSVPARLRASAPWCRRPRASWRLRCLPPPLPLWTVWVLRPPPPPPPPRPLPRPSRTTPAWPSSSPCSRRAGRRSSSGDHPVRSVAARCSSSSSKQIHILYTWVQTNIDIEVSGYILFILFRNLISTLECFSLWECCEIVSGCKKRPFSLFVAKFEINCNFLN